MIGNPAIVTLLLDEATGRSGLSLPAAARALVVIVHPDGASRRQPGWDFVADVLHANGLVTLPLCLLTAAEETAAAAPPGAVQRKLRLLALFDWLARQPAMDRRPLALIGLGEAARDCIAAAARLGGGALKSLVLLDARIGRAQHHLARLSLPTLFVLGGGDGRGRALYRGALRRMSAAHRLEVLPQPTSPLPAPGALEAFACSALEWIGQTLPPVGAGPGGENGKGGRRAGALTPPAELGAWRRGIQQGVGFGL